MFPNAVVLGHRDFSTDTNGNGIIDKWEWIKSCPSFDVRDWLKSIDLESRFVPSGIIYKLNFPLIKSEVVTQIQASLLKAGYKIKVDGVFGQTTSDAVKLFQKKSDLNADGVVGTQTAKLLNIKILT